MGDGDFFLAARIPGIAVGHWFDKGDRFVEPDILRQNIYVLPASPITFISFCSSARDGPQKPGPRSKNLVRRFVRTKRTTLGCRMVAAIDSAAPRDRVRSLVEETLDFARR